MLTEMGMRTWTFLIQVKAIVAASDVVAHLPCSGIKVFVSKITGVPESDIPDDHPEVSHQHSAGARLPLTEMTTSLASSLGKAAIKAATGPPSSYTGAFRWQHDRHCIRAARSAWGTRGGEGHRSIY